MPHCDHHHEPGPPEATDGTATRRRAGRIRRVAAGLAVASGLLGAATSTAYAASPRYPVSEEPGGTRPCTIDGITVEHGSIIVLPGATYECVDGTLVRLSRSAR